MDFKLIDRILALGNLIGHAKLAYIEADHDLLVTSWNKGARELFGYTEDDVMGQRLDKLIPLNETQLSNCTGTCHVVDVCADQNGQGRKCRFFFTPIMNTKGDKLGVAVLAESSREIDINKDNMPIQAQRLRDIFNFAPIGFFYAEMGGKIVFANPEFAWMLGYETADAVSEQITDFLHQIFYDRKKADEFMFVIHEAGEVVRFRCRLKRKDGSFIWAMCYAKNTLDDAGRVDGVNGFAIDISKTVRVEHELKKANEKLKMLSLIDGLTQIPNRRKFDGYLSSEWRRHFRGKEKISLILCDIDFFKLYNDTYGHQEGDTCLKKVAQAIDNSTGRSSDLAARYGGEEFAVVLPHTDEDGAMVVAEKIRSNVMNLELSHEKSTVHEHITLSLGVTTAAPGKENSAENLVFLADEALYQAKANGRNQSFLKTGY